MTLYKTKFKEKKNTLKEFEHIKFEQSNTWMLTDFVKRPMQDDYWFVLKLYCEGMEPTPISPFHSVVVSEAELKEYFEELH